MNEVNDISNQPLIEWGGQTVITTAQLAEVYGATTKNISNNFKRNETRFEEGKHYFVLQGAELKEFMRVSSESGLPQNTSIAYLWTRRGASRHCKILGTDKAWEQFDYLEENYFDRKATPQFPQTVDGQIRLLAQGYTEMSERVVKIETEIESLKMDMPILPIEADRITAAVKKKGVEVLGGKDSNAYHNRGLQQKVYRDIYGTIKHNFGDITTYKAIKRCQTDKAVEIVGRYELPFFLKELIDNENAQENLKIS